MKPVFAPLVIISALCCSAYGGDVTVSITDISASGSPLTNVGSATLSESAADSGAVLNHMERWSARNKSGKPIVAIVETLRLHYPNGSEVGVKYEHDRFFHSKPVLPGEDIEFTSVDPSVALRASASKDTRDASCDVVVRWVQYADGTTFGDPAYAAEIMDDRAAILKELRRLVAIYQTEGLERFSSELRKKSDTAADGYIDHLRSRQDKEGAQAAIDALLVHLGDAESQLKLLTISPN